MLAQARRRPSLRSSSGQLELGQPAAPLDPEQVGDRRAAHRAGASAPRGSRSWRASVTRTSCSAPRQPAAHHPVALIGIQTPSSVAGRQQPRERPRVEAVGLRARLADPRIGWAQRPPPARRGARGSARSPTRCPMTSSATRSSRVKARAEQLQLLGRRIDPARRAHLTVLGDRDLTEIAMHIQPDRSTDRSHLVLLWLLNSREKQRANDTDGFALTAQPGKSQGRPLKSPGSKPIVQNGLPTLRSP